jgi:hypothetical protein
MRRSVLATVFCLLAWPCGAGIFESIPANWHWPPFAAAPSEPSSSSPLLSSARLSAAHYRDGLTVDALRERVSTFDETGFETAFAVKPAVAKPPMRIVERAPVPIEEVCDALVTSAHRHDLPVKFFIRLIWQESKFDPKAVSPVGAKGVAQFMPATANAMGLDDPFDPIRALQTSARLLRDLVEQFGNLGLAAAAYNAGPKKILDWLQRRARLPEETRDYVLKITGHLPDRWRHTARGKLLLETPKRAPCQAVPEVAAMVEVPAPVPPPPLPKPKPRSKTHLIAKQHDKKPRDKEHERAAAHVRKQVIINVAAHRAGKKSRPKVTAVSRGARAPERSTKSGKSGKTASKRGRTHMAMGAHTVSE